MSTGRAASQKQGYGRSAGLLTIALGIAGVLTYAFFAIASHSLDAEQYGNIVILWSVVFLLASTLFRPIEQLLTRTLAEREQVGAETGDALRAAAAIQGSVCLVAVLVLLLARDTIERELFAGEDILYWILIASLLGFGLAYYARGFLAGRGQFRLYAALLIIEVSARLAFAVAVAAGIASGANFVALGIATAPVAVIIVLPLAVLKRPQQHRPKLEQQGPDGSTQLTLGRGGAFAGAVLVMMLSEQVLINSGALFVRAAEGAAAAGFIFNVMMVARAPLVLFQAIAASLLPHLTRLRARGGDGSKAAFRSSVETTLLLIAAFAGVTIVGVVAIGPQVMQMAFGDTFTYDRLGLAIVAVGMGFYLAAASLNQAALAQAQAHRAAGCWIISAAVFVAINLVGEPSAVRAVEIGFAVSAAVLAGLLYALYTRPSPSEADVIEPGSGRELQAQLTSTDEIV